ncbi:hypothetical protein MSAN_02479900 [Mycena sanguinolenta]|uniref:Uncharacterized protein n=1 Tax=Mycena sanguinolenta TaxID=230812 RepID=A0A8H6U2S4_9AGAR|nr:hypothetical protein MSAN_02479900 [Mycena sanguinolenta]
MTSLHVFRRAALHQSIFSVCHPLSVTSYPPWLLSRIFMRATLRETQRPTSKTTHATRTYHSTRTCDSALCRTFHARSYIPIRSRTRHLSTACLNRHSILGSRLPAPSPDQLVDGLGPSSSYIHNAANNAAASSRSVAASPPFLSAPPRRGFRVAAGTEAFRFGNSCASSSSATCAVQTTHELSQPHLPSYIRPSTDHFPWRIPHDRLGARRMKADERGKGEARRENGSRNDEVRRVYGMEAGLETGTREQFPKAGTEAFASWEKEGEASTHSRQVVSLHPASTSGWARP